MPAQLQNTGSQAAAPSLTGSSASSIPQAGSPAAGGSSTATTVSPQTSLSQQHSAPAHGALSSLLAAASAASQDAATLARQNVQQTNNNSNTTPNSSTNNNNNSNNAISGGPGAGTGPDSSSSSSSSSPNAQASVGSSPATSTSLSNRRYSSTPVSAAGATSMSNNNNSINSAQAGILAKPGNMHSGPGTGTNTPINSGSSNNINTAPGSSTIPTPKPSAAILAATAAAAGTGGIGGGPPTGTTTTGAALPGGSPGSPPYAGPLNTNSPLALAAAAAVTPEKLAGLLLAQGPLPIRHITNHLALTIPGFGELSLSKQRRLIIAALDVTDPVHQVRFDKVGWGRWAARKLDGSGPVPSSSATPVVAAGANATISGGSGALGGVSSMPHQQNTVVTNTRIPTTGARRRRESLPALANAAVRPPLSPLLRPTDNSNGGGGNSALSTPTQTSGAASLLAAASLRSQATSVWADDYDESSSAHASLSSTPGSSVGKSGMMMAQQQSGAATARTHRSLSHSMPLHPATLTRNRRRRRSSIHRSRMMFKENVGVSSEDDEDDDDDYDGLDDIGDMDEDEEQDEAAVDGLRMKRQESQSKQQQPMRSSLVIGSGTKRVNGPRVSFKMERDAHGVDMEFDDLMDYDKNDNDHAIVSDEESESESDFEGMAGRMDLEEDDKSSKKAEGSRRLRRPSRDKPNNSAGGPVHDTYLPSLQPKSYSQQLPQQYAQQNLSSSFSSQSSSGTITAAAAAAGKLPGLSGYTPIAAKPLSSSPTSAGFATRQMFEQRNGLQMRRRQSETDEEDWQAMGAASLRRTSSGSAGEINTQGISTSPGGGAGYYFKPQHGARESISCGSSSGGGGLLTSPTSGGGHAGFGGFYSNPSPVGSLEQHSLSSPGFGGFLGSSQGSQYHHHHQQPLQPLQPLQQQQQQQVSSLRSTRPTPLSSPPGSYYGSSVVRGSSSSSSSSGGVGGGASPGATQQQEQTSNALLQLAGQVTDKLPGVADMMRGASPPQQYKVAVGAGNQRQADSQAEEDAIAALVQLRTIT